MVTNNKDFRVKHGLVVEQDASITNNLTVGNTITTGSGTGGIITGANNITSNNFIVNTKVVFPDTSVQTTAYNSVVYDKANSANVLAQAAFDKANSSYDQTNTAITLGSTQLYHGSVNTSVVGLSSLSSSNLISNVSTFNTTFNGTAGVGQLTWNDGDGTLDLGLKGGNTTLQLGQESVVRVYNDSGSTLNEGEVVYISGSQGNRIAVKRAQANSESTSVNVLGMVTENISNGAEGFVTTFGLVNHLNTIGLTGGPIFLSPTVAGAYTQTKPVAPNHLVIVGFVNRIHATVGSLFIRVDNGYELEELHNVYTDNELNDDLLAYNTANTRWENKSSATVIEPAFAQANAAYNQANASGILAQAAFNQANTTSTNSFSTIAITGVVDELTANTPTDTLTFTGESGIYLNVDKTNNTIAIATLGGMQGLTIDWGYVYEPVTSVIDFGTL